MKHFFKKSDDSDELKSKTNDADQEATGNPEQPIFHEKRIMNQIAQSPSCDPWELSRKFPDLFSKKAPLQLTLPQGWVGFVEKCLESYQQAGLKAHIVRFGLLGGNLVVNFTQEDRQNDFRELLVTMLRQTANYCPFCGQPYASHPLYKYDNHVQVCDECLKKIGFDPNLNMHSDDDDAFDDDPEIMLAKN